MKIAAPLATIGSLSLCLVLVSSRDVPVVGQETEPRATDLIEEFSGPDPDENTNNETEGMGPTRHSRPSQEETAKRSHASVMKDIPIGDSKAKSSDRKAQSNLVRKKAKRAGLGVEQLKQILRELQEEEEEEAQPESFDFDTFSAVDEDDDRTLLDVFGEAAKEFLTKKVIPDTDPECRWDWRTLRCESACDCEFRFKAGDYHLGRACRFRNRPIQLCDEFNLKPVIGKRFVSLVQQTAQIIGDKVHHTFQKISDPLCKDLRRLHIAVDGRCLPRGRLPGKSIPQRLLCGPLSFSICQDETDE